MFGREQAETTGLGRREPRILVEKQITSETLQWSIHGRSGRLPTHDAPYIF